VLLSGRQEKRPRMAEAVDMVEVREAVALVQEVEVAVEVWDDASAVVDSVAVEVGMLVVSWMELCY